MRAARIVDGRPIGKPKGWDEKMFGHCATLHVRDDLVSGMNFMTSAWELDPLEAGWLLAGANVHLGINGRPETPHPVVRMGIGEPPLEFLPVYTITSPPVADPGGRTVIRVMRFSPKGSVYADAYQGEAGIAEAFGRAVAAIEEFAAANGMA